MNAMISLDRRTRPIKRFFYHLQDDAKEMFYLFVSLIACLAACVAFWFLMAEVNQLLKAWIK